MKPPITKIVVDVPLSETRRERVERDVFARLEAMRDVDRAETMAPVVPGRRTILAIGFAVAAAAAAVLVIVLARDTAAIPAPVAPSLVVTPAGGSSRFTVGDSVIDAGSDTSVEVQHDGDGGTTLRLGRGSVDCDVAPRLGRPPFRVIAGEVSVEVVGTRFAVARHGAVTRVDVTRGKVRVHGGGEQRLLGAGESWSTGMTATLEQPALPAPVPASTPEPVTDVEPDAGAAPEPAPAPRPAPRAAPHSPKAAYEAAQRLERTHPAQAARAYRSIANGKDAYAAVALLNLAELHATTDAGAALRALDELARRFPRATNAEEAAWLRVDVLRTAGRPDDARRAAGAYLRDFPQGTYAKLASRLVRRSVP